MDRDLNIKAIKRPNIPSPKRKHKQVPIEGRDGDLYIDEECYEDITISIDYNFIDKRNFHEKCRSIKRWLNKIQENKLVLSDDHGVFYKVKKVEVSDNIERIYKIIGKFTVKFICDPYTYYEDGEDSLILRNNMTLDNDYEVAKPIYIIKGNGNITLSINNKPVVINVGQEVTINTKLELCFKSNQMINLALKQGTFKDLCLQEGENIISFNVTSGTINSIEVIPSWRTI
jgi:predicted phage tail component-like protein